MAKLIDADKFLGSMIKRFKCVPLIGRNDYDCESLKQMLVEAPTVDAVEVVRCMDCDFKIFDDVCKEYYCNCAYGLNGAITDNTFCSYGERRTDEAD